ncbi:MAG: efflux RND transporter periplasmic adaptor subunit [Candidatus Pacebacteria bacterium]|nr:efflux RND transporter periplasmic adaptor subunit [Candidatus Paceibacterota bacterium]
MKELASRLSGALSYSTAKATRGWKKYRSLKIWQQVAIGVLLAILLIGGISLLNGFGGAKAQTDEPRTVTLATAGSLSGGGDGTSVIGTIRSVTEADILAESGGKVRSVRTTLGASVPAGFIIAELDNASQRATVLQAEGAYDAAIAARNAVSPKDTSLSVRNTYRSAFTALDSAYASQIDLFFGGPTPYGPSLLINAGMFPMGYLSGKRQTLQNSIDEWRTQQATAATTEPEVLLDQAQKVVDATSAFLADLARAANDSDSGASTSQMTALASARATVNQQQAALAAAREAYRGKSISSTASVDASVKQALGNLRGAQAQLEKTLVRAPISGTVNFLPIRVGDYVTAFTHVATVAQNGSLELVTYISEDERTQISVGEKVTVETRYTGIITSIAPALSPTTHQIEIHIAISNPDASLVNGQSVRITLPGAVKATTENEGPLLLPLASVKLRTNDRVVFSVDEQGRLVEHAITTGEVRGGAIEVLSGISAGTRIVTDARGLSAGQKVSIADNASL